MSHVAKIAIEIKDLEALEASCKHLGLELVRGQKTYKWYGRTVGDYQLPQGFAKEDLGHCDHAIRIPNNLHAYEIGVCRARNGKPGFELLWDFWNGGKDYTDMQQGDGKGLTDYVGSDGLKLTDEYGAALSMRHYARKGYRVSREKKEDGRIIISAVR